jgi:hypothetical protein
VVGDLLGPFRWFDAHCIDQSNEQDRGHQVRLMSSIYSQARNVLIWLGKDHDTMAVCAFATLCTVINNWNRGRKNTKQPHYMKNGITIQASIQQGPPQQASSRWHSISALFSCSWFWRLWVVQEAALAKSASVLWGDAEMSWSWAGLAASIIRTNDYNALTQHSMSGVYNAYLMYRLFTRNDTQNPLPEFRFLDLAPPHPPVRGDRSQGQALRTT